MTPNQRGKCSIHLVSAMICNKCGIDKDETEFVFKNKTKGKRHTICKECQKQYKLKYYYDNKQSHYERNNITRAKIAEVIDNYKENHPCILCGESSKECLDFHHLHDKDVEVSKLRTFGSIRRVIEEIDKCVVLCANCHRKVHAGTINIGTSSKG